MYRAGAYFCLIQRKFPQDKGSDSLNNSSACSASEAHLNLAQSLAARQGLTRRPVRVKAAPELALSSPAYSTGQNLYFSYLYKNLFSIIEFPENFHKLKNPIFISLEFVINL